MSSLAAMMGKRQSSSVWLLSRTSSRHPTPLLALVPAFALLAIGLAATSANATPTMGHTPRRSDDASLPHDVTSDHRGNPLLFQSLQEKLREHYSAMDVKAARSHLIGLSAKAKAPEDTSVPAPEITDYCYREDVDGCSIPFGLPFFDKKLFTPSCDRHDICYHCGVEYGIDRYNCDLLFRTNMRHACMDVPDGLRMSGSSHASRSSGDQDSRKDQTHRSSALRSLIDDKTHVLENILKEVIGAVPGDVIHHLLSPVNVTSLREKVILRWVLFLSQNLHNMNHLRPSTENNKNKINNVLSTFSNNKNDNTNKNARSQRLADTVLGFSGNSEEPESTTTTSTFSWREKTSKIIINTTETEGPKPLDEFCAQLFRSADAISMSSDHKYRVSDYLDCEDVDTLVCYFVADLYFVAVRVFGYSSYHQTQEDFCGAGFVKDCLVPM